jgi:hypothetical protein
MQVSSFRSRSIITSNPRWFSLKRIGPEKGRVDVRDRR